MAVIETWLKTDLKSIVKVNAIHGNLFSQDNMANLIGVELLDGGETASVSGSVSANVLRADGTTVAVAGTLSGNRASVTLPQAAYAVPGVLFVVIKLTSGSTVTTIGAIQAIVYRASTDTIIDPGTILPSVQDLIAQIDAAVASIPPDYSELTDEVGSLKSAFKASKKTENAVVNVMSNNETAVPLTWENGFVGGDGESSSNISQRTASYIPLFDRDIKVRAKVGGLVVYYLEYDENYNYLGTRTLGNTFTTKAYDDSKFVRFSTYSTTVPQSDQGTNVEAYYVNDQYINRTETENEIEKTRLENYIEGTITSFSDGIDSNLRELVLLPHQSGSGVPSADNIRPFVALTNFYLIRTGENMFPDVRPVTNGAGITMEKISGGGFHFYGTSTGDYYHNFTRKDDEHFTLPPGEYELSYDGELPSGTVVYFNSLYLNSNNRNRQITIDEYTEYGSYIYIPRGKTVDITINLYLTVKGKTSIGTETNVTIQPLTVSASYGVGIDMLTGDVRNKFIHIASYDGETIDGYWLSDRDVYKAGQLPSTGAEVVYLHDGEIIDNIGAIDFAVLKGRNNIWTSVTDCGVKYDANAFDFIKSATKYVTPEMFGAYGDGVTDDTIALQFCIDFAIKYGLDIELNNNYFVSKTITIRNAKGLNIIGRSVYGYNESAINSMITINSSFSGTALLEVINSNMIKIDGLYLKGYSRSTKYGIHIISGSGTIKILHCNIVKFMKGIYTFYTSYFYIADNNISQCTTGIEFVGSGDSTLENNYINTNIDENDGDDNRSGTGILLSAGSSNNKIIGGKIEWNTKGIYVDGSEGIIIANINFDFCPKGSILIKGSIYSGNNVEGIVVTGCHFRAGGVWGSNKSQIVIDPTLKLINATITGNIFQKAQGNSTTETDIGPETILKTVGNGNPITLVFVGNNMTDGATTNEFVLQSDNETIAYSGNLSGLARVITGTDIEIIE